MLKHPKIGDDLPNLSASVHQVATIHHAAGHVFAMTRIALHHHGSWLEDRHGDLCHRELLMIGLLRRDDRSIGGQHEVDARIWDQIRLEPSRHGPN